MGRGFEQQEASAEPDGAVEGDRGVEEGRGGAGGFGGEVGCFARRTGEFVSLSLSLIWVHWRRWWFGVRVGGGGSVWLGC